MTVGRLLSNLLITAALLVAATVTKVFLEPVLSGAADRNHQLIKDKTEINKSLIRFVPPADLRDSAMLFVMNHEIKLGQNSYVSGISWDMNRNILISWYTHGLATQCVALLEVNSARVTRFRIGPACMSTQPTE